MRKRWSQTYQVIDNSLTWLFLTNSKYQEIREFSDNFIRQKNKKQMPDSYSVFQQGNIANSKKFGLNL